MNDLHCNDCGQFVPYADLDAGRARHVMITPDSAYTSEEWETVCAKCVTQEKERKEEQSNEQINQRGSR